MPNHPAAHGRYIRAKQKGGSHQEMKIKALVTTCGQLVAGELFSSSGEEYWANRSPLSVGEKVYLRTDAPCPEHEKDDPIFKIEVER